MTNIRIPGGSPGGSIWTHPQHQEPETYAQETRRLLLGEPEWKPGGVERSGLTCPDCGGPVDPMSYSFTLDRALCTHEGHAVPLGPHRVDVAGGHGIYTAAGEKLRDALALAKKPL